MPSFTWNIDPVMLRIPRDIVAIILAGFGLITLFGGYRRKANESIVFGLILLGGAAAVRLMLKGPFEVRYYSLVFVLVFLGGYLLLNWQVRRGGGDKDDAADFIIYGVLGVLIGARLGHVLFYDMEKAINDPWWIFAIWTGGLASHGAVLGLIYAMYRFTKSRDVPFLEGSDRFAFSAALGATLVRIGNFFNSEIVGRRTDGSWGVRFPRFDKGADAPLRYPTQLYEAAIGIFVLICLFIFDRALGKEKRPRGAMISLFFALYFPLRFGVEFWKEHQVFQETTLDMGHYLSIPGALLGFYGLYYSFKHRLPVGWTAERRGEVDDDGEEALLRDLEREDAPARRKKKRKKKKRSGEKPKLYDADVAEEFETGVMARRRARNEGADASGEDEGGDPKGQRESDSDAEAPPSKEDAGVESDRSEPTKDEQKPG
jgi:prolipoprotein diacylglyceryl transferase